MATYFLGLHHLYSKTLFRFITFIRSKQYSCIYISLEGNILCLSFHTTLKFYVTRSESNSILKQ